MDEALITDIYPAALTRVGHLDQLSSREIDVVQQLVDGHSTERGAAELFISRHTFRTHVKNIYRKLGTHSSLELVSLAVEMGMRPSRTYV